MIDSSKRIERAEKALQKGKPELALAEYLAILEEDPGNEAVSHTAADVSVSLGRNHEAIELLSGLFERQCRRSDKTNAAITYKKLSRITRPTGEQSLTFAHSLAKNNEEALKAYQAALKVFTAKQRKREALSALNGIVALTPSVENFRQQGELAADLDLKPEAAAAYFAAGELEKEEDAKCVLFERAYRLHPQDSRIALSYANCLLSRQSAERAAQVAEPFTRDGDSQPEARSIYGRAMLSAKNPAQAMCFLWEMFESDPANLPLVEQAITALTIGSQMTDALEWLRKLDQHQIKAGKRRDFVQFARTLPDNASIEFLEYLAMIFDTANREQDYCATLLKLFDLHHAAAAYAKAAACLDRAVEIDAYEPGHASRLDMLREKVDARQFNAIAGRLGVVPNQPEPAKSVDLEFDSETTVLEDLLLQAQIYTRYSMPAKALEKLTRIQKLFPGEEYNNRELRELYALAGIVSQPPAEDSSEHAAPIVSSAEKGGATSAGIGRLTEITTNLYRQSTVKNVLFAFVNDAGRHWKASRCLAVLCTPGKPPSIAIEYCAPGLAKSDIHAIVKQVGILQPLLVMHGALNVSRSTERASSSAQLRKILPSLGIKSILAVPLVDGTEHVGLLALSQSNSDSGWSEDDMNVLSAISEQVVLAVSNARLRKLVHDLAATEEDSGLVKRSSYLDVLVSEIKRGLQQTTPLSLMLLNFRRQTGPDNGTGDLEGPMQHIAELVRSHVRQNDVAVRYDANTLALILGDTTSRSAQLAADKLRRVIALAALPVPRVSFTISIGISEAVLEPAYDPADLVTEVVNRAERSLVRAISMGENSTAVIHAPVPSQEGNASRTMDAV